VHFVFDITFQNCAVDSSLGKRRDGDRMEVGLSEYDVQWRGRPEAEKGIALQVVWMVEIGAQPVETPRGKMMN